MNFIIFDDVVMNPDAYVKEIHEHEFVDIYDGQNTFKNIQPRDLNDEFTQTVLQLLGYDYSVAWNFVRRSPAGQEEPNFVHTDEMMGDITAILYLSKDHPEEDGTTIYNKDGSKACSFYSKYNRMVIFESKLPHSRNIFENFGKDETARLVQVAFLKILQ
jgi:hypothetical protein